MASATKRIASEALAPEVGPIGAARIDRVGVGLRIVEEVATAALIVIVAAPPGVAHRTEAAADLPTGNATGREWAERPIPPGRWMGGSDCRRDV